MKRLIALVIVASFLFSILAPLGLSIQSTQEKTITNPLRVTYFFFGRIDDLQRDDYATSFIGKNVLLYFYSNSPDMKGWYAGHIKGTQRFYVSSDYEFHGFMTLHFVCGVFKHQLPSTPSIMFMSNIFDNSITVMSVSPENILWSDITNVGSGNACSPQTCMLLLETTLPTVMEQYNYSTYLPTRFLRPSTFHPYLPSCSQQIKSTIPLPLSQYHRGMSPGVISQILAKEVAMSHLSVPLLLVMSLLIVWEPSPSSIHRRAPSSVLLTFPHNLFFPYL